MLAIYWFCRSQILEEIELLKALQHELAYSRAVLKAKSSELEEAKKAMKHNRHLQEKSANEMAQRDSWLLTELLHRSRMESPLQMHAMRQASPTTPVALGPASSTKLVTSKEESSVHRKKSMRTPQPNDHRQDLLGVEDVQLAIGCGKPGSISRNGRVSSEQASAQFPCRSSLGGRSGGCDPNPFFSSVDVILTHSIELERL